jgi:hypothetical protein
MRDRAGRQVLRVVDRLRRPPVGGVVVGGGREQAILRVVGGDAAGRVADVLDQALGVLEGDDLGVGQRRVDVVGAPGEDRRLLDLALGIGDLGGAVDMDHLVDVQRCLEQGLAHVELCEEPHGDEERAHKGHDGSDQPAHARPSGAPR